MPPKKATGKKDEKRTHVFQGVVICEDFDRVGFDFRNFIFLRFLYLIRRMNTVTVYN